MTRRGSWMSARARATRCCWPPESFEGKAWILCDRPSRERSDPARSSASFREIPAMSSGTATRSEEHTSELQSRLHLVCRLLLEKKKKNNHESKRLAVKKVIA